MFHEQVVFFEAAKLGESVVDEHVTSADGVRDLRQPSVRTMQVAGSEAATRERLNVQTSWPARFNRSTKPCAATLEVPRMRTFIVLNGRRPGAQRHLGNGQPAPARPHPR